jgi:hypothetical protein
MRSSIREVHALERRAQSRPAAALRRSRKFAAISSRDRPTLSEHDERDAAERGAREAPVAGARTHGPDQAARLVEAQRRRGDAAPSGNLLNRQQVIHEGTV